MCNEWLKFLNTGWRVKKSYFKKTNFWYNFARYCMFLSGLSVVTMCVDLASTHLKAYFTRIHYFGRAKRFLGMSEELKEIVALLGAMRRKKGGKVAYHWSIFHLFSVFKFLLEGSYCLETWIETFLNLFLSSKKVCSLKFSPENFEFELSKQ